MSPNKAINDFQKRVIAAQDLLENIKNKSVNCDGSITVFHGTSIENAEKILKTGEFRKGAYFSVFKKGTKYGDSPVEVARRKYGKNGTVLELKIDARAIELAAGNSELYSPYNLIRGADGVWKRK